MDNNNKDTKKQQANEITDWDTAFSKHTNSEGKTEDVLEITTDEPEEFIPDVDDEVIVTNVKTMSKATKFLIARCIIFPLIAILYFTVVFSNNSFIRKWRTIYIETAMTTTSHQYLATWIFPKSVIDVVMDNRASNLDKQKNAKSTWDDADVAEDEDSETKDFFDLYWELDSKEFRDYLDRNPSLIANGYDHILIEDFEGNMNLKSSGGDRVLVVDTENGILIFEVKGEGYIGKLAIVKDSDQIDLVKSKSIGSFGQEAGSFGEDYDALLVVNASGFVDVDGVGTGGEVKGSMIIDGVEYGDHNEEYGWKFIGLQNDKHIYVSDYPANDVNKYRWGVEFIPAIIIDGKSVVDGTFGMGMQPRTALGQAKDGSVQMLIIDGRQVGYSIGATMEDLRDILMRYQCYQAMNLDGGSSSIMWYKGNYITKSSSVTGIGRYMPDALIVKKATEKVTKQTDFKPKETNYVPVYDDDFGQDDDDEVIIDATPKH